jgi:hypothetical protein
MQSRRFAYSLLLASAAVVGLGSSAFSFTLTDDTSVTGTLTQNIYYGADNTYNGADVIGTSPPFNIFSAVVTRSGPGNDTLNIRINTNFAGAPALGTSDGTTYGSLFLNPLSWSANKANANNTTDNFVNGNQNWFYAVTTPTTPSGAVIGTSNLYATGLAASGASGVNPPTDAHGVPQYYTTVGPNGGTIYMSNVAGNPLSAPALGNPGDYFRQGQAVTFVPYATDPALRSVTITEVNGSYIQYSIVDNGLLNNTFALAWDMTCANDVIQGLVTLGSTDLRGTPLPAALPLFAGGLGVMGLLAGRRKRKNASATAAA